MSRSLPQDPRTVISTLLQKRDPLQLAAVALGGAALVAGLALVLHHLFLTYFNARDLETFRRAAWRWLSEADPYGVAPPLAPGGPPGSDFAYPLPALYLIVPLAYGSLAWAATILSLCGFLAVIATPPIWLRDRRAAAGMIVAGLVCLPFTDAIAAGQLVPIIIGIGSVSALLLGRGQLFWSGLVLPLILIKPQIGAVLGAAILLISWPGLGRRWWLGHAAGWLIFWGGSLALDPTWPWRWIYQLRLFAGSNHYQSTVASPTDLPVRIATLVLAIALVIALVLALRRGDRPTAGATLITLSMLIVPLGGVYDRLLLWMALVLIAPRFPSAAIAATSLSWAVVILLSFGVRLDAALLVGLIGPAAILCVASLRRPSAIADCGL